MTDDRVICNICGAISDPNHPQYVPYYCCATDVTHRGNHRIVQEIQDD